MQGRSVQAVHKSSTTKPARLLREKRIFRCVRQFLLVFLLRHQPGIGQHALHTGMGEVLIIILVLA